MVKEPHQASAGEKLEKPIDLTILLTWIVVAASAMGSVLMIWMGGVRTVRYIRDLK